LLIKIFFLAIANEVDETSRVRNRRDVLHELSMVTNIPRNKLIETYGAFKRNYATAMTFDDMVALIGNFDEDGNRFYSD
jgi:hypothetical protein